MAARSACSGRSCSTLLNSIGFAHILPISLALFTKIAPKQITATVIGLYYLAFFAANKIVGYVGGLYSSLPTTTFWLIHVASAAFGLVAFAVFKVVLGKRMRKHSAGPGGGAQLVRHHRQQHRARPWRRRGTRSASPSGNRPASR